MLVLALLVSISTLGPAQIQLDQAPIESQDAEQPQRRIGFGVHAGGFAGPFRSGTSLLPHIGLSASFNPIPAFRIRGHIEGLPLPTLGVLQSGIGVAWTPSLGQLLQPMLGVDIRGALTTGQSDTLDLFVNESSLGAGALLGLDIRPLDCLAIQPFVEIPWYPGLKAPLLPSFNLGIAFFPDAF